MTCLQEAYRIKWPGGRNIIPAWARTANGKTPEQWNAAAPAERMRWLMIAYDQKIAKCPQLSATDKSLFLTQFQAWATKTYPQGGIGVVVKAVGGVVKTVAGAVGGPIGTIVSRGLTSLTNNDTPKTLYAPLTTGQAGPPNPNALTSGTITKTRPTGQPLFLLGGLLVGGVLLYVVVTRGR